MVVIIVLKVDLVVVDVIIFGVGIYSGMGRKFSVVL